MNPMKSIVCQSLIASSSLVICLLLSLFLSACGRHQASFQGYIEGRFRYISTNYSGVLTHLFVERGSLVKAGQRLFTLEQLPESAGYTEAEARFAEANAQLQQTQSQLALAKKTFERRLELLRKKVIAQEVLDSAQNDYLQAKEGFVAAKANLAAAQATLKQKAWSKEQKSVTALVDAIVFDTYFLPSELVPANRPVLSLLAAEDIKVVFYVPETILSQLKLGKLLRITLDGFSKELIAKVSYISPQAEYTPPVIYSNESRSKLVFRIEAVPLQVSDSKQLHPGQPVQVSTDA